MVKAFMGMADFYKVGEDELYDVIGGCGGTTVYYTTYEYPNGATLTVGSDGSVTATDKNGKPISVSPNDGGSLTEGAVNATEWSVTTGGKC